jgi:pSer/pThr/pTyr-binding forkhead associated (FHA) protein
MKYEESFELEDFSTNGTYLNGTKLVKGTKYALKNNDEIGIVVVVNENSYHAMLGYIFRDSN